MAVQSWIRGAHFVVAALMAAMTCDVGSAFLTPARVHSPFGHRASHLSSANRNLQFATSRNIPTRSRFAGFGGIGKSSMKAYDIDQDVVPDACPADGKALVYFSGHGDLRIHDHPGLEAAASGAEIHAVFVYDPTMLVGMTERQIKLLASSVEELQSSLSDLAVTLDVKLGDTMTEVKGSVQDTGATHVYVHSEPTVQARSAMEKVREATSDSGATMVPWTLALRSGLGAVSDEFPSYERKLAAASLKALSASRELLLERAQRAASGGAARGGEKVAADAVVAASEAATDARLRGDVRKFSEEWCVGDRGGGGEAGALALWERYKAQSAAEFAAAELEGGKRGLEQIALERAGGVAEGLFEGEAFVRGFRELLGLGCVSPRLVHKEAYDMRWATRPLPFGAGGGEGRKLRAAEKAVEGSEWHRLLALVDEAGEGERADREVFRYKYWKWRGHWVRYAEGGKEGGAPVVMVHGFGASADQWERLMANLHGDHRVFAVDKLGFGHSEKPELTYTQYLWERNVQDFCMEVVGAPCFLAGNSIGGYTALGAATGLGLAQGLVLMNSAGRMVEREVYEEERAAMGGTLREVMEAEGLPPQKSPPQWVLDGAGNLAISLLRGKVEDLCRQVYPNFPDMVDDRLVQNIIRDSKDPGGYSVLASGAKLPPPRTKNELLQEFRRPLLVTQGLNDPLGGGISKTRFSLYEQAHPEPGMVRLVGLEAGHCPHHETPEEVSSEIRAFVKEVIAGSLQESPAAAR